MTTCSFLRLVWLQGTKVGVGLVLLALAIMIPQHGEAQLYVGPKAAVNMGRLFYFQQFVRDRTDNEPMLGYSAGFVVGLQPKDYFGIFIEGNYLRQNARVTATDQGDVPVSVSFVNYEVPIIFRWTIRPKNSPWMTTLNIGPVLGYWASGKGQQDFGGGVTSDFDFIFDAEEATGASLVIPGANRYTFSLAAGVGAMYRPVEKHTFALELRAQWGHSFLSQAEVADAASYNMPISMEVRHSHLALQFSYLYHFDLYAYYKGRSTQKD